MAGGYGVIKDVPKTLVYELCEYRNSLAGHDLIPQAVIDKPPSAELRPDQRDDESLPPYAVLDPILEGYVEQDLTVEDLVAAGFEAATVRRVIDLVDRAEYKRRQAPPGPRVTSRGFGKDRRMPITNRFRALRRAVTGDLVEPPRIRRGVSERFARSSWHVSHLGERAPQLAAPGCARWAASASLAHAWRASLLEDLLPVSVGLPDLEELTVLPAGALAEELARVLPPIDAGLLPPDRRRPAPALTDNRTDDGRALIADLSIGFIRFSWRRTTTALETRASARRRGGRPQPLQGRRRSRDRAERRGRSRRRAGRSRR